MKMKINIKLKMKMTTKMSKYTNKVYEMDENEDDSIDR